MRMELRTATPEDAKGVALVMKQSYRIDSLAEGEEIFKEEMAAHHRFVVAAEGHEIIGFASWTVRDLPRHELGELNRIAVHPDHRGKNIGEGLFFFLVQDAKKFYLDRGKRLRKLFVMTHASNHVARQFYAKVGFKLEATLKDHYYRGEDECVYSMFFD